MVILYMVIKEFPENRRQREELNKQFFDECEVNRKALAEEGRANRESQDRIIARYEQSMSALTAEFRKELSAERAYASSDRQLEREIRKELSALLGARIESLTDALTSQGLSMKQVSPLSVESL